MSPAGLSFDEEEDEAIAESTESFMDASGMIVELYGWGADPAESGSGSAIDVTSDKSYIKQIISLRHNSAMIEFHTLVNWRENRKLLKVTFPVNIRSDFASYEMQCGLVIDLLYYSLPLISNRIYSLISSPLSSKLGEKVYA
jgi:hypothetical protein